MRPALQAKASQQAGLITRTQALDAGYRERELRTLTAMHGQWVVVRRGIYVEREVWTAAGTSFGGQDRLRDLAAHLSMQTEHVLSHDSAVRAWGLPMLRAARPLTHITRRGVGGSRTEHGVKHHLTRVELTTVTMGGNLPVTGLARTAIDMAREHGWLAGTVVMDAVVRRGAAPEAIGTEMAVMRSWPGITQVRAALEHVDPGAENPGETVARILVHGLGLGRPQTQFPVRTTHGIAWVDLILGCHAIEFDGRQKFRRVEQGGVADRPVEDVLWEERKRQQAVCAEGLGMSRILWEELWPPRREAMLRRVRGEYAVTAARFGPQLPEHLIRFAQAMEDERLRRIYGRAWPAA